MNDRRDHVIGSSGVEEIVLEALEECKLVARSPYLDPGRNFSGGFSDPLLCTSQAAHDL